MTTSMAPRSCRRRRPYQCRHLTGRKMSDIKMVVNGAGAAAIACTELFKASGVSNTAMC
jgi:malic enzyme